MGWKLGALLLVTAVLVLSVIPIRTHAVLYDPAQGPPPRQPSLWSMIGNMYLTPGTFVLVLVILGLAGFVALRIVRGRW